MLKDATYKQKYQMLTPWMPHIIEQVKKDLKQEHLRQDFAFARLYLGGKNINKVSLNELAEGYTQALQNQESDDLAEFISSRWILKNTEIYEFFEKELTQVHEKFSEIELLEEGFSKALIEKATAAFGTPKTYIFSVMNAVVFPEKFYKQLKEKAEAEKNNLEQEEKRALDTSSIEKLKASYELELKRLEERHEKKLSGFERKYQKDIEVLKKQVANLQKKHG